MFLQAAAAEAERSSYQQGGRSHHQSPKVSNSGKEPGRCPGAPSETGEQRWRRAKRKASNETDEEFSEETAGQQNSERANQGYKRQSVRLKEYVRCSTMAQQYIVHSVNLQARLTVFSMYFRGIADCGSRKAVSAVFVDVFCRGRPSSESCVDWPNL